MVRSMGTATRRSEASGWSQPPQLPPEGQLGPIHEHKQRLVRALSIDGRSVGAPDI